METCQSGLMYLFAKEAGASKPLDGSNPSVSAKIINYDIIVFMDPVRSNTCFIL